MSDNKIEIKMDFGGFYNSMHSDAIEELLTAYFNIDDEGDFKREVWDYIYFKNIEKKYSEIYFRMFKEWVHGFYDYELDAEFIEVVSPASYNFETDSLLVKMSEDEAQRLITRFLYEFRDEIENESSSRPGFASFYNGFGEVEKSKEASVSYILLCLSRAHEYDADVGTFCSDEEMCDFIENMNEDEIYDVSGYEEFLETTREEESEKEGLYTAENVCESIMNGQRKQAVDIAIVYDISIADISATREMYGVSEEDVAYIADRIIEKFSEATS